MRLHRFYITEEIIPGQQLTISSTELVNQVRRVFRLRLGDKLVIFNGTGFDYVVKLANYGDSSIIGDNNGIVVDVGPAAQTRSRFMPTRKIFLYAAIVKKDTFEWIVEKATELGVTDIVPVMAERSEKKNLNEERLKKISVEASEQSGRGDVPAVHPIVSFDGAVRNAWELRNGDRETRINTIAFHTEGEMFHKDLVLSQASEIGIFIGPEGGWSGHEIEVFHTNYISVCTLGPQVLRAETAVVAALSQVVF